MKKVQWFSQIFVGLALVMSLFFAMEAKAEKVEPMVAKAEKVEPMAAKAELVLKKQPNGETLVYDGDKPFTGIAGLSPDKILVKNYDPKDASHKLDWATYKDGKLHGEKNEYYKKGQLKQKAIYINGQKHGEELKYYVNNQLKQKVTYVSGQKHGEELGHYNNDQSKQKASYNNGQKAGEWVEHNPDGSLKKQTKH